MIRQYAAMLFACTLPAAGWACSPPPVRASAGFVRHHVERLPKNALGVMFLPAARTVDPNKFSVTSREDKRPLALRVRTLEDRGWVRLELVHGFQAGASYTFRYLPSHGHWQYPDRMRVSIDDAVVATEGNYAIALAPRPRHRVVVTPTSSGSCVVPSPAVVREFTYTTPPSVAPYRDVLAFDTEHTTVGAPAEAALISEFAQMPPSLYYENGYSLGLGMSQRYTASRNAMVAPCGKGWPRIRLASSASFPEVDQRRYPMPAVSVDMNSNIEGRCDPLDALVNTVDWRAPEASLRDLCHWVNPAPLASIGIDIWTMRLGFFYGMSPTCDMVALTYLWRSGQFSTSPPTMNRLGTALVDGMRAPDPAHRDAAIAALAYLVDALPPPSQARMARDLLSPLQATLVEELTAPRPLRPRELARLIRASGGLPPGLQQQVRTLAGGSTEAAREARALLAPSPGKPRP